jgi:hypothetical protein
MTGALDREYLAALRTTSFANLAPLLAAGIPWRAIAAVAPALAMVRVDRLGITFEPDEDGAAAYVFPVRVGPATTPESGDPLDTIARAEIVDLIAMHPAHPGCWALRRGVAEWLGAVEPQYLDPEPVPVWRSPSAWLRGGCHGLTLLSRERASQYRTLSSLCEIVAEDLQHAAELRRILERPWSAPRVIAPRLEVRRAA